MPAGRVVTARRECVAHGLSSDVKEHQLVCPVDRRGDGVGFVHWASGEGALNAKAP